MQRHRYELLARPALTEHDHRCGAARESFELAKQSAHVDARSIQGAEMLEFAFATSRWAPGVKRDTNVSRGRILRQGRKLANFSIHDHSPSQRSADEEVSSRNSMYGIGPVLFVM